MFGEHCQSFGQLPTKEFVADELIDPKFAYRLFTEYDDQRTLDQLVSSYLSDPRASETQALLIGAWFVEDDMSDGPDRGLEALIAGASQLPELRALFIGDIIYEECEVSWIEQGNLSAIWDAFPRLEELWVRGTNSLSLGTPDHDNLAKLVVQGGGLSVSVLKEVAATRLPNLEHLELYLGDSNYGWDGTVDDVLPLLNPELFPNLKYLGLKDSEIQNEVVAAVMQSPIIAQLETLDFSCGVLTDEGAAPLLSSDALKNLKRLDLHHHFLSTETMDKLMALPFEVDVSDQQKADEYGDDVYRYVAVGE